MTYRTLLSTQLVGEFRRRNLVYSASPNAVRSDSIPFPSLFELTHASALPAGYEQLLKSKLVSKILLGPLSDSHIHDLICSEYTVRQVPPVIDSAVKSRAQGNPFFACVLLESMIETGACCVAGGVMAYDETLLGMYSHHACTLTLLCRAKLTVTSMIEATSMGDKLERVLLSKIDRTLPPQPYVITVSSLRHPTQACPRCRA